MQNGGCKTGSEWYKRERQYHNTVVLIFMLAFGAPTRTRSGLKALVPCKVRHGLRL